MEVILTRNITLTLDLIGLFIQIKKIICIYMYIKIDSLNRNLGDGFMIYSKNK